MTKLLKLTVYSVCGGDFYSNGNLVSLVVLSQLLKGEPASSGQRNIILKTCGSKDTQTDWLIERVSFFFLTTELAIYLDNLPIVDVYSRLTFVLTTLCSSTWCKCIEAHCATVSCVYWAWIHNIAGFTMVTEIRRQRSRKALVEVSFGKGRVGAEKTSTWAFFHTLSTLIISCPPAAPCKVSESQ